MGKSQEIKKTDGRINNRRLKPKPISTRDKMLPQPRTTKSKKDRISTYALSAMKEEFGSEKEFFKYLARQSKANFNALKLFLEYAYGKPSDSIDKEHRKQTRSVPIINFNIGDNAEKIIDISHNIEDEE